MTNPIVVIAEAVRERLRGDGIDPAGDGGVLHRYVADEVRRYSERALGSAAPLISDDAAVARQVVATLTGFGALQQYLDDPDIEEIWINAPDRIFVARNGISHPVDIALTEQQVRDLVERMLHSTGRRVDLSTPFVDASLPDGSRLHVVIPDITRAHWAVNVRKFRSGMRGLSDLVRLGSLPQLAADYLDLCVRAGHNILVSGATQSGKTTLLGALLGSAPAGERVVTVEETFELALSAPDWVALQCRQPSLEGTGEVSLRRLIKEALRMRPDRLIVGEVREAESLDLLIALNSGLPLFACSIMGMRAALYARISDDEPDYDKPAVQLKNLRALAKESGYSVVAEFHDRVSAFANARGELKDRPGFGALMRGIGAGQFDVVMAVAPDRFSRDAGVHAAFKRLCRQNGVGYHTRTLGVLNLDNPVERAQAGFMDVSAELDVAMRMAKQRDRFEDEVSNGNPLWGVRPFGYDADPNAKTKRWTELHETEADEVRWAYSVVLDGGTVYKVLKSWNERGILTTRGKPWAYASVRQLLLRPRNAGIVMHRDEEQVGITATWKPLVSREDFDTVRAILTDPKKRTAAGRKPSFLMSSLAVCGVCGAPMRSGQGNGEAIYKCATKTNAQNIGERHAAIAARLLDPRVSQAVAVAFLDSETAGPGEEVNTVPLDAELAKVRAARQKIIGMIARDLITEGDAAKDLAELKEREASLEAERTEAMRASAGASIWEGLRNGVLALAKTDTKTKITNYENVTPVVAGLFDALELDQRRVLVRSLLKVTVNPGRTAERVDIRPA